MKLRWLEKIIRWLDRRVFAFFGLSRRARLAQGLEIVEAVLHKRLNAFYSEKYSGHEPLFYDHLATAVLGALIGRDVLGRGVEKFARDNRSRVDQALRLIPKDFPELRAEITRALYVKALLEGDARKPAGRLFERVNALGIFDPEVMIPEPKEYFEHALRLARDSGFGSG